MTRRRLANGTRICLRAEVRCSVRRCTTWVPSTVMFEAGQNPLIVNGIAQVNAVWGHPRCTKHLNVPPEEPVVYHADDYEGPS